MRHIPEPPSPHTPVKPRGSSLIPLVTPRPILGPTVLTPGSSLGSYIVTTDQHESFMRTLSSLMHTRENFPVGHPSQIDLSQARLTWRFFQDRLPKKKMHLVGMITLLILLSLGPGHPIPRARISQHVMVHKCPDPNRVTHSEDSEIQSCNDQNSSLGFTEFPGHFHCGDRCLSTHCLP
jgi:hypothetical protein